MAERTKQVVIVTGAAAGIGRAIASGFAAAGHDVALLDVDGTAATDSANTIAADTGAKTMAVAVDVTDRDGCLNAQHSIVETFGPASVLVNNAGIMPQQKGWIEELPPEHFDGMIAIHVGGAVNWARLVIPDMRAAGFGRIINIASANAILAVPHRLGYVTAKKAVLGVTQGLALDCARSGITVNAIAPGYILTDTLKERADKGMISEAGIAERTPVGRWGATEDIANAALFLAAPASGYITGTTLVVDGGLTIRGDPGEDLEHSPMKLS